MKKMLLCISSLAVIFLLASCDKATIKEKEKKILTYQFSDPNPIANPSNQIYPYFRFDGYTNQGKEQEWKMVELENKYIRLSIMPGQGGKIWGATEKSTGENFIYENDVVKFRDIAMRGAWTSGGVEVNFGIIGHAPWTATPVDYTTRENEDGSVSCFVGTLDLLTRAWWSCEIKLEKDKAYFTTNTKWYNPTYVGQPYYHWMNAGYNQTQEMEFYFPGDSYIGHDGIAHSWPMDDQGHNLAKYKENNFGSAKSHHVVGDVAQYYATYWHDKEFGSAHHSSFDDKMGMKIFLWGLSDEGMIWKNILSDNGGQYVELQSGRLFNQESPNSALSPYKHFSHQAGATENFVEYWYPIKETKGVTQTNQYATVNLVQNGQKLEIYLSPLQKIDQTLVISEAGKELYRKQITLAPMETFKDQIDMTGTASNLKLTLGDNLLVYDAAEKNQPLARPKAIAPGFDVNSLYGKYVMGCQELNIKHYDQAKTLLEEVLAQDPHYAPALNALASIDYLQGRYAKAVERTLVSLSIDTYDPDANMIYGASNAAMGRSKDAIDGFSVAGLSSVNRPAAYIGLAKQYATKGEWPVVVQYANKILQSEGFNADAYQLIAVAERKMGNTKQAIAALDALEKEWPINHFVRVEKYRMDKIGAKEVSDKITSELAHELLLEIGLWYESLGALQDAIAVYELGQHPLLDYRKAYAQHKAGVDYQQSLTQAAAASPAMVFPSRHEMLEVFEWADKEQDNWKNKYYLALINWHLGNNDTAFEIMQNLGQTPDYAPFYISRAQFKEGASRMEDLLKSESMEKSWRIGMMLIDEYKKQNDRPSMLAVAEKYHNLFGDDFRLGMAYVPVLMDNGRYEDAIKYLENVTIIPYEGAFEGRSMYRNSYLSLALREIANKDYKKALANIEKSKIWIENLGVGKPYDEDLDLRSEDYLTAYCYQMLGEKDKAAQFYQNVAQKSQMLNSNTILSALALRQSGKAVEAKELLSKYQTKNNNPAVAKWAMYVYNGNRSMADQIIRTEDLKAGLGAFGANEFKDYGFIAIVKDIVYL